MYFRILADHGALITGYVVPDSVGGHSQIVLRHGGRDMLVRPADELRQDLCGLIEVGRHQTGACGFTIDEASLPGLREMDDLEIYEVETQTLIYRRRRPHHIDKRVLRLESHLYPLWRLDSALNPRFQYWVNRADSLGRETTTQMLSPYDISSVFVSARILYRVYQDYIEPNFDVVFIMHHPLEELAERLIILQQIKTTDSPVLDMRDNLSLRSAMDFAQSLSIRDEKAFVRQFRKIPSEVARIFANPVVQQLTCATPDELPGTSAVSAALGTLASFKLVGLRRAPRLLLEALAELVGVDALEAPLLTKLPGVTALARMLKRTGAAEGLLDLDLELYHHVAGAYRNLTPSEATDRPA